MQTMALEKATLKKLALPSTAKKRKRSDDDIWNEWIAEMSSETATQKRLQTEELELRKREISLQEKKWEKEKKDRARRAETEMATLDLLKLLAKKLD